MTPELDELVSVARQALRHAYAPYSRFRVGAALRTKSGRIFQGCNVENASYGATLCAERAAVVQMVSAGEHELESIAICVEAAAIPMPCGMCRQVLAEFADDALIVVANPAHQETHTLRDLLPHRFRLLPSE